MALVAKMAATEVKAVGGGRFVACSPDDEGAQPVAEFNSHYGPPPWWPEGTTHFRFDSKTQARETFEMTAVSAKGEDDPNREWAMYSPSGSLTLVVDNPEAWGYIRAGAEYRITIERIRGPRSGPEDDTLAGAQVSA